MADCECKARDMVEKEIIEHTSSQDPWANRHEGMRCRTCMFFVQKAVSGPINDSEAAVRRIGRCRRHAPTLSGYPVVFGHDWCGDHKLDQTKL